MISSAQKPRAATRVSHTQSMLSTGQKTRADKEAEKTDKIKAKLNELKLQNKGLEDELQVDALSNKSN